jgi:hypothetical protein
MAIIKNGILGGVSGKAGPIVGSSWKRIYILKTRSKKKIKKKDLLPQHFKIGMMSKFLKPFLEEIRIGFNNFKQKDSQYNRAMSYNLHRAVKGTFPDFVVDYPNIKFSRGDRETAWSGKAVLLDDNHIKISWEIPETVKLKIVGNDLVRVMMYAENKKIGIVSHDKAIRKDLEITIKTGAYLKGNLMQVWLFFVSPDGKSVSDTDYIGAVQLK